MKIEGFKAGSRNKSAAQFASMYWSIGDPFKDLQFESGGQVMLSSCTKQLSRRLVTELHRI